MHYRFTAILLIVMAAGSVDVCSAQQNLAPAPASGIPRTADGKPDLNGIWQAMSGADWNLEDHLADTKRGIPAGLSVVEGGTIPYKPAALEQRKQNLAKLETLDPIVTCLWPGVPRAMYMPVPVQINMLPNLVAITSEYVHTKRLISFTGKHPERGGPEFWMGDSRARWEGDTLVLDTDNFNDKTWFDRAGNFHSDELHVVERLKLMDPNAIWYEATIEDPKTFTRPWKISMPLYRRMEKNIQLLEYECLEDVLFKRQDEILRDMEANKKK